MNGKNYVYKLKDDLDPFISVVLYTQHPTLTALPYEIQCYRPYLHRGPEIKNEHQGLETTTRKEVSEPAVGRREGLGDMWRRKLEGDIPSGDRVWDGSDFGDYQGMQLLCATFTAEPPIQFHKSGQLSGRTHTSAKRP